MVVRSSGAVLKRLRSLFDRGSIVGLSDGELLERFAAQRDEDAFAALVERHGPMVVRLCRQVIGDHHEAQDAAQAAFLVLARRAGAIRRRDSVASWLYRVARRLAVRARSVAARRREAEWRVAQVADRLADDGGPRVPQTELYEELDRLAERYRAPLVLCYLEGLTHEQAAQHLRCPVRTVETRLLRGRARLRERLIRRGVSLSAALAGATGSAPAAVSCRMARDDGPGGSCSCGKSCGCRRGGLGAGRRTGGRSAQRDVPQEARLGCHVSRDPGRTRRRWRCLGSAGSCADDSRCCSAD